MATAKKEAAKVVKKQTAQKPAAVKKPAVKKSAVKSAVGKSVAKSLNKKQDNRFCYPLAHYGAGVILADSNALEVSDIARCFPSSEQTRDAVCAELAEGGRISTPLIVYRALGGKLLVADGFHRLSAVRLVAGGFDVANQLRVNIPARVCKSEGDAVAASISANFSRRNMTAADYAVAANNLVDGGFCKSLGTAAKHFGISLRTVQNYRAKAGITNPASVAAGHSAAAVVKGRVMGNCENCGGVIKKTPKGSRRDFMDCGFCSLDCANSFYRTVKGGTRGALPKGDLMDGEKKFSPPVVLGHLCEYPGCGDKVKTGFSLCTVHLLAKHNPTGAGEVKQGAPVSTPLPNVKVNPPVQSSPPPFVNAAELAQKKITTELEQSGADFNCGLEGFGYANLEEAISKLASDKIRANVSARIATELRKHSAAVIKLADEWTAKSGHYEWEAKAK